MRALLNRRCASLRNLALILLASALAVLLLPVGHAYASACPNEAVRVQLGSAQLPDCRAYELVSPASKNGWSTELVSATDSHAILESIGAFVGSDQQAVINYYDSARTPDGWTTSSVSEPSGFLGSEDFNLLAKSNDLSQGLFVYSLATTPTPTERNIYLRALPGGHPAEVGPIFPPGAVSTGDRKGEYSLLSSSGEMRSVLFAISGQQPGISPGADFLWPGDTTVANTGPLYSGLGFYSLYDYTGTDNTEPELVGVSGGHGSHALISDCGTSLAFPSEGKFDQRVASDVYNAISAEGTRVFFTAAAAAQGPSQDACTEAGAGTGPKADELFARTAGSETTAISEPSQEDCSACEPSTPAEAVFQGASEDGSKVLFLSEQQLLAGAEGVNLYEYDFDPQQEGRQSDDRLTLVAPNLAPRGEGGEMDGVVRLAEDGSRVYFVAQSVRSATPSPTGELAQTGADNLYVFDAATRTTAFIADLCSDANTSGSVSDARCPAGLNSLPPSSLAARNDLGDWQQEDRRPIDLTPDGRFLVFTSNAELTPGDTSSVAQIFEYDAQAGTLVRVSAGQAGFNDDGNTNLSPAHIIYPTYNFNQDPAPQLGAISNDGATVVFQSSDALTPQAAEGYGNVYEYRAGQVSLVSDGQDRTSALGGEESGAKLLGIDGSGTDVFFKTADQLVPQDGDTQVDVYDARREGGFPVPTRARCTGDECQAPPSPPPLPLPGVTAQEAGNLPPPAPGPAVSPRRPIRTQNLAHALRVCRAKHDRRRRAACEARSRKAYGVQRARRRTEGRPR